MYGNVVKGIGWVLLLEEGESKEGGGGERRYRRREWDVKGGIDGERERVRDEWGGGKCERWKKGGSEEKKGKSKGRSE